MFGNNGADLARWLTAAERHCAERCRFNQGKALEQLAATIGQDRRFDDFDAPKLAKRASEARQFARVLDLADPSLKRGGEERPQHWNGGYPGAA
jgi:hypothetical protein